MKKFNPDNVKLLMTDTDSLLLHIRNENPYEVMLKNKEYFDLSMFPKYDALYDPINKKVAGKFKLEEVYGEIIKYITEFCGLRSKLYSYLTYADESIINNHDPNLCKNMKDCPICCHKPNIMKCKGAKKSVVENQLTFQKYKDILTCVDMEQLEEMGSISQNIIRSYKHQVYSETVPKIALSPNDDKVYILNDKINTLTFGSCYIPR